MGLCLSAKGYDGEDFQIGYIGFGFIRKCIASSYNEEFGQLYSMAYGFMFKEYTQEQIDRWNEICDDDLDILLNHSDCDGKLTWKECRKIINALDKIDFKYPDEWRQDYKEKYYILKDMIRYCAENRKTLRFG